MILGPMLGRRAAPVDAAAAAAAGLVAADVGADADADDGLDNAEPPDPEAEDAL